MNIFKKNRLNVTFTREKRGKEDVTTNESYKGDGKLPGGQKFTIEDLDDGRVLVHLEGSTLKPCVVWNPGKGGRVFCGFRSRDGFGTFVMEDKR